MTATYEGYSVGGRPEPHPPWCDPTRCTVDQLGGMHESAPTRVSLARGGSPRLMLLLTAPIKGAPIKLRAVVFGDVVITTIDLSLDEAHLAANTMIKLIAEARPVEI